MAYITREDGERFVIPSYRDVLDARKSNLLKKEILLLSTNYGEYITIQKKNADQVEVAFSPDTGYLLGETVWHYFKKPDDLIYCEAIPNTMEAILVIVKQGSVYLDGSFPIDSIPEELVVFRTQQNDFEIYIQGPVPLGQTPAEVKFSLDPASVKSFNILEEPAFPQLPLIKGLQLQLVEVALKAQGIGGIPLKQIIAVLILLGLAYMGYNVLTTKKQVIAQAPVAQAVNPLQGYLDALRSPDPVRIIHAVSDSVRLLLTIPGWSPSSINYENGSLHAKILSNGLRNTVLFEWAKEHDATIETTSSGWDLSHSIDIAKREEPKTISKVTSVIATLIDRLSYIDQKEKLPVTIGALQNKVNYNSSDLSIAFTDFTPERLDLLGDQLKDLPLVLSKVAINLNNGRLSGTINLTIFGN